MPDCTADATWHGPVMDGDGDVSPGSGVWSGTYATPETADATDPEELLAASHASCFAMTAAYLLDQSGYDVVDVDASATVTLERTEAGFEIPSVRIAVDGVVPDATAEEFAAVVERAEAACPVSTALAGTEIEVSTDFS
ncbi:OsmC family peroxiredoxin [Halobacteriales archaeon QS_8_69_26]|nr:MAG: OsmC family peroxiredoxin [Halobacteriales archaeon QS_8_69_26]